MPKVSRDLRGKRQLLREEAGRRAIAGTGIADPVGVELDLAAVEVEVRRAVEPAIGLRTELVARTVGVQLLPADEPLRVRQRDGSDDQRAEAKLVGHELLASPANRLATVAKPKLSGDDQDVALLDFSDLSHRFGGADGNPKLCRRDLAFAVVVELPRGRDLGQDQADSSAVLLSGVGQAGEMLGSQRDRRRDGEPSFGTLWESRQALGEREGGGRVEVEHLGECRDLFLDRLRTRVLGRVGVAGGRLLVGELVGATVVADELADQVGEATSLVHTLGFLFGHPGLVVRSIHDGQELEPFRVSSRD